MRKLASAALFSVGVASQLLTPGEARPNEKDDHQAGYHLQQTSTHMPVTDVALCGNKVRFDTPLNNITTIVDGDNSKITILNNKTKSYFLTDLSHWSPSALSLSNVLQYFDYSVLVFSQSSGESFNSFPVTHEKWLNPTKYVTPGRNKDERLTVISADAISCGSISKNPTILKATQKYFNIGPVRAYPLQFESMSRKGSTNKSLTTKIIENKTYTSPLDKLPADYKPIKNQRDIYLDKSSSDTLEDMLR